MMQNLTYRPIAARFLIILFVAMFISAGCGERHDNAPDTSSVKIDLKTYRFDLDLYAIDTNHLEPGLKQLLAKYPDFLNYFLDTVMAYGIHGNYSDTTKGVRDGLRTFLTHNGFRTLEDTIKKNYPDSKAQDEQLKKGFTFLKYYFPKAIVPRVIYLNMGLSNWPSFPIDDYTICVGLDMFLGEGFPYYNSIGVPGYMATHLRPSYIPVSVFSSFYKSAHPFQPNDKSLLELMMQRGKEQYFLHKVLPATPDSVLFGYTGAQVEWCNENESMIYNFFIHGDLLFNKETQAIQPFVFDGPNTPGLPTTSKIRSTPGNLGSWLGYKIVSAYMAQHEKTTLEELTTREIDASRLLDESKYRPK